MSSDVIIDVIELYGPFVLIANAIVTLILIIALFVTNRKLKELKRKYKKFMNGSDNKNIEELLLDNIKLSNDISLKNKEIENRVMSLERDLQRCIQKLVW